MMMNGLGGHQQEHWGGGRQLMSRDIRRRAVMWTLIHLEGECGVGLVKSKVVFQEHVRYMRRQQVLVDADVDASADDLLSSFALSSSRWSCKWHEHDNAAILVGSKESGRL